jgi:hypothetical protein
MAFKITFCGFIIRSSSLADTISGLVTPQGPPDSSNRTTHVLIGPDN